MEAAPSSAMERVVDFSERLTVADVVSLTKVERLGEADTSAWTSRRREAMLPAKPS